MCRDLPLTEALDYLSAIAIVFHGVLLSVARVLGPRRLYAVGPLSTLVVGGCFAAHCRYMLLVKFDYGWNMKLCVALGVAQSLLWMVREALPDTTLSPCLVAESGLRGCGEEGSVSVSVCVTESEWLCCVVSLSISRSLR